MSTAGTVVLVHGGFVDGSGWQEVYRRLKKDGEVEMMEGLEREILAQLGIPDPYAEREL